MRRFTPFLLSFILAGYCIRTTAQTVISWETFPSTFNLGLSSPMNTSFQGSIGLWNAYSETYSAVTVGNQNKLSIVNNQNPGTTGSSTATASSPVIACGLSCIGSAKLTFLLNTYQLSQLNTHFTFYVELSANGGSTWEKVFIKTAQELYNTYGSNTFSNVSIPIPVNYFTGNFRYRLRGTQTAGSSYNNNLVFDDIKVTAYPCSVSPCPNGLKLGGMVWNDKNLNGVRDSSETAIANVTVKLYKDNDNDNMPDGSAVQTTVTDASGYYVFSNLTPGNYIVGVIIPSGNVRAPQSDIDPDNDVLNDNNGWMLIGNNTAGGEVRSKAITLTDGGEPTNDGDDQCGNRTLNIGLCEASIPMDNLTLGNLIWRDNNGNGIRDAGEPGIAGVTVYLYTDNNNDNIADSAAIKSTTTDANGNYLFSNLKAGNYLIGITIPAGLVRGFASNGANDPDNDIDNDNNGTNLLGPNQAGSKVRTYAITLAAGTEPANDGDGADGNLTLDIGLCPAPTNVLCLGDLIWRDNNGNGMRDAGEPGLAGVTVYLYKDDNNDNVADSVAIRSTVTDANGMYNFSNLFPGNYLIGVTIPAGLVRGYAKNGPNDPDNNIDNDNNGTNLLGPNQAGSKVRTYSITLAAGTEPDGNCNYTLDIGLCPAPVVPPGDSVCFNQPIVGCTGCNLAYPDNSNLPRSAVVFSESDVLRAAEPGPSTCGAPGSVIKLWYNDEHAMTLGVRRVIVKTSSGTTTTDYNVTPTPSSPTCVLNPNIGASAATGDQSGNDVAAGGGRPLWPALFITDLTVNGLSSRAGDWQQGGVGIPPHKVCGTWKAAVRTVDNTKTPAVVTVTPDADPVKNNWNLGGGDAPSGGFSSLANEGYGAEVAWNVNDLGLLPGHVYRLQFMVHDGDQNKTGGDAGESCTTVVMPGSSTVANPKVNARSTWKYNNDGTVTIRTTLAKTFVDNTYGTNAMGYPSGHTFGNLLDSDNLKIALYDTAGNKKMEFAMDYLSAAAGTPSGYKSLGVSGGDGSVIVGNTSDIVGVKTSMDVNLNDHNYNLTANSPATNASYTPNPSYPNWIYDVWYEATVKASAFGSAGFGYPRITGVNAGPSKTGDSSPTLNPGNCPDTTTTPPPPGNDTCFTSPTTPNTVNAKSTWTVNTDGTVTIRTTFAKTFVDNTYGTTAVGWKSGHKFGDLVGSDHVQLALYDRSGTKKIEFKIDYISQSTTAPSGYTTLGVTGGDGKMILGSAYDITGARTSLSENFNTYNYVLTTNSPATDTAYTANPSYPDWIYDVWYEVTVKQSVFGSAGFGYPLITSVHASPSKTGNNTEPVNPGPCVPTTITAQRGGQLVSTTPASSNLITGEATLYPNPATDYFNIRITAAKSAKTVVRVTDASGRALILKTYQVSEGVSTIKVDNIKQLQSGTYNVQTIIDGKIINHKLVVFRKE